MEIDNRNEGQDCAVSASQLANGSLVYSVSWTSNRKQRPALYIREPKKTLETMIAQRTAIEGKYFVDVKAGMAKTMNKKVLM